MHHTKISLLGYASDIAGANRGSCEGPEKIQNSAHLKTLSSLGLDLAWQKMIQPDLTLTSTLRIVQRACEELCLLTTNAVLNKTFFTVFGGDHTCAIGTWSGVSHAKHSAGPIGLIWVDAHLDSHTPQTSESGHLHGMPLACLLGEGEKGLTQLLRPEPKIEPDNLCIIGARSYEEGEIHFLNRHKVRIFFMDEIKKRGMNEVMKEAILHVTKHTSGYGISIDVDSIDPLDAPGTGVIEPNGISGEELCQALTLFASDSRLLGAEIAEFDPSRDKNQRTEKLIIRMLSAITQGRMI